MAADKVAYFKNLHDLTLPSDDEQDISAQEDNRASTSRNPRALQDRPKAGQYEGKKIPQRTSSTPLPLSIKALAKASAVVSQKARSSEVSVPSTPEVNCVEDTPASGNLLKQTDLPPRRTVSNPAQAVASNIWSSSPPPPITGKRKRNEVPLKPRPDEEQIFKGLTFFYIPNDDIAPVRRARITKARQYGATWATSLSDGATHIIVDKNLTYKDIVSYLKIPSIPSDKIMVNDAYPLDCIQYRAILDSSQKHYMVKGHQQAIDEASRLTLESEKSSGSSGSVQSLPLKPQQSKPGKWDYVPPRNTPPRSEESTQMPEEIMETRISSANSSSPQSFNHGDALDEMIREARRVEHLPLDEDDDHPSSQETSEDPVDSDEENASVPKTLPPRSRKYGSKGSLNQEAFSCMKGGTGTELSDNPNARTVSILQEMAEFYARINDTWRPIAYRKAISTLRQQSTKITSAEEAFRLPFIGQRLALKIEEIVLTDRLRRLENAKTDPNEQILQLFMNVYGVGSSQAYKWLAQGHKTLEDLVNKAELTGNQRVGIEHYHDFLTRIPRAELTSLGDFVKKTAASIDDKVEIIIGGSYRRGAASSGDIDCIVTKPGTQSSSELIGILHQLVTQLTIDEFLVTALSVPRSEAGSKWHGCCLLPGAESLIWRRIDFLLVPASELGAALIYFTGNDIFNRSIRLLASRKGMRLNQRGLYKDVMRGPGRVKITEGELIEGADEKRIFDVLEVPWRPPQERIC